LVDEDGRVINCEQFKNKCNKKSNTVLLYSGICQTIKSYKNAINFNSLQNDQTDEPIIPLHIKYIIKESKECTYLYEMLLQENNQKPTSEIKWENNLFRYELAQKVCHPIQNNKIYNITVVSV